MTITDTNPASGTRSFADLDVPAPIAESLAADGVTDPFPIQADTLPDTLAGRDVLGRGKTGSGKTLAFSIPLAARLADSTARTRPGRPRGLVLAPTRELATQITAALTPLAKTQGLRVATIFGGVKQGRQVAALESGVDIIVACPGRLEDLMGQGHVHLDSVEVTVVDEADHMADLGFLPGVTRILKATDPDGQRLLFSATLDNGVDKLIKKFMHSPATHSVDSAESPVVAMTHHVFEAVDRDEKKDLVRTLASGTGRRILFTRTKHQAKKLAHQLTKSGIPAVDLHGNLSQNARDRNLAAFGAGDLRVLVATDIAARGVHVDDVELVVHVDPPAEHKAYLHRSGRTARAGHSGDVVTVMLPEQRGDVTALLRKAGINAKPRRVTAASAPVVELVGETAPRVEPHEPPAQAQRQPGQQQKGRGNGGRDGSPRGRGGKRGSGRGGSGDKSGSNRAGSRDTRNAGDAHGGSQQRGRQRDRQRDQQGGTVAPQPQRRQQRRGATRTAGRPTT